MSIQPDDKTITTIEAQSMMAARLQLALMGVSHRAVAYKTGFIAETVRRYRKTGNPSWHFLSAIVEKYGISAEWLLLGTGPMMDSDKGKHVLESVSTEILLSELSKRIDGKSSTDSNPVVLKDEVLRKMHPRHQRRETNQSI